MRCLLTVLALVMALACVPHARASDDPIATQAIEAYAKLCLPYMSSENGDAWLASHAPTLGFEQQGKRWRKGALHVEAGTFSGCSVKVSAAVDMLPAFEQWQQSQRPAFSVVERGRMFTLWTRPDRDDMSLPAIERVQMSLKTSRDLDGRITGSILGF